MKLLLILTSLSSFSLFAASPKEVIKEIEISQNAKCERYNTSTKLCLNDYCRYAIYYQCLSSTKSFKVKLKVSETTSYNEAGDRVALIKVKRVVYP